MTLEIFQFSQPHPKRRNYWRWEVWIDGASSALNKIESVTYFLHPTFANQVRVSRSRRSKFRIKSAGWGEFMIRAQVRKKSGEKEELKHWLRLQDDVFGADRPAKVKRALKSGAPHSVFLSYAASDARLADSIRDALQTADVHVTTASDLPSDLPWEQAIQDEIERADVALAVKPPTESAWINAEVQYARDNNVKVVPVVLPGRGDTFQPAFRDLAEVRIKDEGDVKIVAQDLVARLVDEGKSSDV